MWKRIRLTSKSHWNGTNSVNNNLVLFDIGWLPEGRSVKLPTVQRQGNAEINGVLRGLTLFEGEYGNLRYATGFYGHLRYAKGLYAYLGSFEFN